MLLQARVVALQRVRRRRARCRRERWRCESRAPAARRPPAPASCRLRPCWPAAARDAAKRAAGRVHLLGRAQRLDEQRVDAACQVAPRRARARRRGLRPPARRCARGSACRATVRASSAARSLPHISRAGTTVLPSRWPQRLGKVWSSSWIIAAPARSKPRTVRCTLSALPKPVSASTITGSAHAFGDARQRVGHFGEGGQADVGAAEPRVGDRRARQVQRLEAGLLGDQRRQRVVDAGREHDVVLRASRCLSEVVMALPSCELS